MRASEDDAALRAFSTRDGRRGCCSISTGTLSPIVARPELAKIRDGARDAIGRLVERLAIVAVISGRTPPSWRNSSPSLGVVLAGLYGLGEEAITLPAGVADQATAPRHRRAGHQGRVHGRLDRVHFAVRTIPTMRGGDSPRMEAVAPMPAWH